MEGFGGSKFTKRKRSATSRRPRPDSQLVFEGGFEAPSHSSTPPSSENGSKPSPDQNLGYTPRLASVNNLDGGGSSRKVRREERKYGDVSGFYGKRCSEGVLAPANWKSSGNVGGGGGNGGVTENKPKKVKLKVGGVTRTFHPKSSLENDGGSGGYNARPSGPADPSRHRQKLVLQDTSDDDHTPGEKGDAFQGSGGLPRAPKDQSRGKVYEESSCEKQIPLSEPVRKSKRVPKRRVLDGALGDEDDEIRYLEKLKASKVSTDNHEFDVDGEASVKKMNISNVSKSRRVPYGVDEDYGSSRSAKDSRKKSRTGRESDDIDYIEDEEAGSDEGTDPTRMKQKKESVDALTEAREPLTLTTRQRALQSGKGSSPGESFIEFPNGLPPAPPRRQKEKLSEVEQQAKKAEAAQRRRLQVEKANKESQDEAIRKIRGQDSSRKKKEDKMRKERDEMAQKRASEHLVLASNTIRWVMGPTGTIVTFGEEVGLPSIFEAKTSSYPPPRAKCAAPSCTNAYKYRDSKLNLPLCSLQCYKAVRESSQTISTW